LDEEEEGDDAGMEEDEANVEMEVEDKKGPSSKKAKKRTPKGKALLEQEDNVVMEGYENEEEGEERNGKEWRGERGKSDRLFVVEGVTHFLGGAGLSVYMDNSEDPYVTIPDHEDMSDEEDVVIRKDDAVILVGRTEDVRESRVVLCCGESRSISHSGFLGAKLSRSADL